LWTWGETCIELAAKVLMIALLALQEGVTAFGGNIFF